MKTVALIDGVWLLRVEPNDLNTILDLHETMSRELFLKECKDKHLAKAVAEGNYPSAVKLGAGYLKTLLNLKESFLVNPLGGWQFVEGARVERWSESEQWPVRTADADEVFTMTRWSDAQHFYVTSNKRDCGGVKFNTQEEAGAWCRSRNLLATIVDGGIIQGF